MDELLIGQLIRRERMSRQWSQKGLCKGICAISYLSKIEQGKTVASPELLNLLLNRLGVVWHQESAPEAGACIDACFDALFSQDDAEYSRQINILLNNWERFANGPYMLDALVLRSWDQRTVDPLLKDYPLSLRQNTVLLSMQEDSDPALQWNPCPFTYYWAGIRQYEAGRYPEAIELLQQSCELAAREGYVYVMLNCRSFLGNCYSNLMDREKMLYHYRIAERIARAAGRDDSIETLRYNVAATELQIGRTEEAYQMFRKLSSKTALIWHKLAICCEKLKRPHEALEYLVNAENSSDESVNKEALNMLCSPVRYRLEHPDYLSCDAYGSILLSSFAYIRTNLPHGYTVFHLPWVLEWYQAHRQYKQAFDLMSTFPGTINFS